MIASNIGKSFLAEYNKQYKTNCSAKKFFTEKFLPLFFDHPKYMMKGGNAPLDNPKIKKGTFPDEKERAKRIKNTIALIESNPAGSSAIGYPSNKVDATTSGQVSNLNLHINPENVYYSWIGGGFGIGVNGGLVIYFDQKEILMDIFKGWEIYRNLLNETDALKGNQIETWNGQWLSHFYSNDFDPNYPLAGFDYLEKMKDFIQVKTQSWVKVVFGISKEFPESVFTGHVFSLGQTNTTIGFIPFIFPQIRRPLQLYKKIFGENQYLNDVKKMEDVYANNYGLYSACEKGVIGLLGIQPKSLMQYMPRFSKNPKMPKVNRADENQMITFNTFITWVSAMLNNEDLLDLAEKASKSFIEFEAGAERARKDRANIVKNLLDSSNRRLFIDNIIPIVKDCDEENKGFVNQLVEEITKMPADNFPYLLTLIRFKYAYQK